MSTSPSTLLHLSIAPSTIPHLASIEDLPSHWGSIDATCYRLRIKALKDRTDLPSLSHLRHHWLHRTCIHLNRSSIDDASPQRQSPNLDAWPPLIWYVSSTSNNHLASIDNHLTSTSEKKTEHASFFPLNLDLKNIEPELIWVLLLAVYCYYWLISDDLSNWLRCLRLWVPLPLCSHHRWLRLLYSRQC